MYPIISHAGMALVAVIGLSACATVGPAAGQSDLNGLLAERGAAAAPAPRDGSAIATDVTPVDSTDPLTVDRAVQVAMVRSPRLQQEYARLGLARAEVLEAVQVSNPRLSVSYLRSEDGPGRQLQMGVALPLVDLLLLPARVRLADSDYERARFDIAAAVLAVTADVQASWYAYVGSQQVADMRAAIAQGTAAAAELAKRFHDAGNISELQLRQEEAVASQARIDAGLARAEAQRARLDLNLLIGLHGDAAAWKTSDRLLQPVAEEDDPEALLVLAQKNNLGLLAARQEAAIFNSLLTSTRRWRWLSGAEIGYERESELDGSHIKGPTLGLELPIFNQGQARLARAQARATLAQARLGAAELAVDSAVRLGAERVRTLRQVVETYRELLVPQREAVVARSQEQQNFMLIGVFELMQAKVKEFEAYEGYLLAVRDYWLARVDLARAVGQRLPSDAAVGAPTPGVQDLLMPANAEMESETGTDHAHHHPGVQP
nr:A32 [uncultured bacterium]